MVLKLVSPAYGPADHLHRQPSEGRNHLRVKADSAPGPDSDSADAADPWCSREKEYARAIGT